MSTKNPFFTVRVAEHWHMLPKEAMESPSLESFKSHLNIVWGNWIHVALLEQAVGSDNLQRFLSTSTILQLEVD